MQFHCSSQHRSSSQCHCHQCHSELFVALAVLSESSLCYAMPCHRCALLRQAVAERLIAFPLPFCSLQCHSNPCLCPALPVLAPLYHCWATHCFSFAIPLHCRSLHFLAFAAQFKSVLFLRVPNQLIALAARSAHIHAIQSRCFFFLSRSSPYRMNVYV